MYDDESIFVFQKRGILCLVKSWEIWECGGRKSVCCAQLACERDIGCDQQSSRVTEQQSRKVTKLRAAQWCDKDVYQVPPCVSNNASFYAIWKAALTSFCLKNDNARDLTLLLPGKPPDQRVLCDPETWLIYNINVISGSMKTFLLLSHHTGDLHMHFIVSQGGQIVHISSTYSSTYNRKLLFVWSPVKSTLPVQLQSSLSKTLATSPNRTQSSQESNLWFYWILDFIRSFSGRLSRSGRGERSFNAGNNSLQIRGETKPHRL